MKLHRKNMITRLACAIMAGLFVTPLLAHHLLCGIATQTIWHGFMSGGNHPIIGLEHIALPISFGVMITFLKNRMMALALFVALTIAGTLILLAGFLLMTELVMLASIVFTGFLLIYSGDVKPSAVVAPAHGSGPIPRICVRRSFD